MSAVTFIQTTTVDGQIAVSLSSTDLPAGSFRFDLDFDYTGANVQFDKVTYSGGSSVMTKAGMLGSTGTVSIDGSLAPSSSGPFATILFDAVGKGTLDVDITSLKIGGVAPVFTDPAAYGYTILGENLAVQAGGNATGTYQPLDTFLGTSYELKAAPQHGSVAFGQDANPSAWTYTPAAGFYGVDSFTLQVSDVFDTRTKTFSVDVSPVGTAGNDTFHSSAGTYHTDGGSGIDTLRYTGKLADFTVAKSGSSAVVTDKTGAEGVDYLDNVERLVFSDGAIALDVGGNGGQAYRLYQAAFDRTPDAAGLGYWMSALDKGMSLTSVADGFVQSKEFKDVYGVAPTNDQLVTGFYENILHRQPEQAGFDYWVGVLDKHGAGTAEVLAAISESAENQAGLAAVIGNGFVYTPYGA